MGERGEWNGGRVGEGWTRNKPEMGGYENLLPVLVVLLNGWVSEIEQKPNQIYTRSRDHMLLHKSFTINGGRGGNNAGMELKQDLFRGIQEVDQGS